VEECGCAYPSRSGRATYVRKVGIVPCQQYQFNVQRSARRAVASIVCPISCSEPGGLMGGQTERAKRKHVSLFPLTGERMCL
jgi:hypothetical protein